MSTAASKGDQAPPCPDPSAHSRDTTLQDQASKAALYVTNHHQDESVDKQIEALGPDGKLSSAGAAASLKHANPKDLPSFPSVGIEQDKSGNTAANLANKNHKQFEYWKPELSSNASKAALLAHKDGGKLNLWQPSSTDTGHSAATLAMGKQKGLSPQLDYGYTDEGRKKALLAATLSTSMKPKPEREPSPEPSRYPDAENASANALNAASVAHKPSGRTSTESYRVSSPANEAARLTHLQQGSVNPKMFTEHPPIGPDHGSAALRGATASMSKDKADREKSATEVPATTIDAKAQAANYVQLQETAQKLAAERLAKLSPDRDQVYREHYGYGEEPKHKLSIRSRKGRSSSDSQGNGEDQAGAKRIQGQMNRFNDEVAGLDSQKRTQDRTSLMAAAEKAVKARMSGIDEDIFQQTGKVTPQMMEQWEAKARAKATADSEKRMENHGLVHIGGGKYMEQSEIDAIAQGRMQPTLDEITETAETRRARDEEVRLDQEQRKAQAAKEKGREKETAEEVRKQKSYEKMQARFEKDIEKKHQREIKELEKARKEQDKANKKAAKQDEKNLKKQRKEQDEAFKAERDGTGAAGAERSNSIRSSSSSEAGTRGVTSTDTAPVTSTDTAPVTSTDTPSFAEEPVAATAPAIDSTDAEPAKESTEAPLAKESTEAAPAKESTALPVADSSEPEPKTALPAAQDPPGVPTDFGHSASHNTSGAFMPDSGPESRRAENKAKVNEEETVSGPKQKRESKVKSFLGRFKRSSSKAEQEERARLEEQEKFEPTKGEKAAEAAANKKGETTTTAVTGGEIGEADKDGGNLYSAPSKDAGEPTTSTTATITKSATGAPVLPELDTEETTARSRSVSPISPSAEPYVSPPAGGVSDELRSRVKRESDRFEEAMDRFEDAGEGKDGVSEDVVVVGFKEELSKEDDDEEAETTPNKSKLESLGLPLPVISSMGKGKGKDESPARTSSKFQEEL